MLAGCPAAKLYKEGKEYDEAGKEYLASQRYLKALGENEKHKKAREALIAVAEDAYKEKLSLAESAERGENYPKALEEFKALDTLLDKLGNYDAVSFSVVNVDQKVEEMANASAEQQYKEAEAKLAGGAWEDAIRFYRAAQEFKRAYKDTNEKVAVAFYAWGDEDLKGNRYRAAAGHFSDATASAGKGFKDASPRAGMLYASLGKHFLATDRCRRSVKDLRRAGEFLGNEKVATDLAAAEECAVTAVAILPFENPTGTNLAGMALGDTLADAVGGKVKAGASEFVRLMERSSLDAILAEQGLTSAGLASGATSKLRGVRYLVIGKLTQVKLEKPGIRSEAKATSGTSPYSCPKTRNDGTAYEGTCFNAVTVRYYERSGRIAVRVAGNVRVIDVKTGEQLATLPLEATFEDAVHYADDFTVNGVGVSGLTGVEHTDGIGVDNSIRQLGKARQSLKTEDEFAAAAIDKLAVVSSKAVLAAVDVEREAHDPATMKILDIK